MGVPAWEYRQADHLYPEDLDDFGKSGWELVAASLASNGPAAVMHYVFKRRLPYDVDPHGVGPNWQEATD